MEKPDFEALVKNISTEDWDYDLAIAGTSPSGRFSCGKDDVIELLEHVWNTHVVPLQEWKDRHIKILDGQGYRFEIERLESENKALREEIERLKEKIDHLEYSNPEDI